MSIAAAATLDPPKKQTISRSDLMRLEGLGDNCEFGFVLRRLGFEDGMLFRWASIRPESLLATLRGDFEALYEFDNLVPQNAKMVRDLHYGTAWHTQLYSSRRDGTLVFDADEDRRRAIHAKEASKLGYLLQKLRAKFEHPNPVFVIKANAGISEDLLEAIHYQLYRRVSSSRFLLLEVQANPDKAGSVELIDRNRMRGYVSSLASYDRSDEGDDRNWIAVLALALAQNAEPLPANLVPVPVTTPQIITLSLPRSASPDPLTPLQGDLRGGLPALVNGSTWCRMVEENTYRLHATGLKAEATGLRWTGVYLPPDYTIKVQAACAIEKSLPVNATLTILGSNRTISQTRFTFSTTDETLVSVDAPVGAANPLTVTLFVEPAEALKSGECSVIDIGSVTAMPTRA